MTTAVIISELLPIHDDALIADIDAAFDEIDRQLAEAKQAEVADAALQLDVEWLVDELLEDTICVPREQLEISLELRDEDQARGSEPTSDEVAEVA